MQFTIPRASFLNAVTTASVFTPTKSKNRSLECVRIVAGDGRLRIEGTNLEWSATCQESGADVTARGEATIPANALRDVLREDIGDLLTVERDGPHVSIAGTDTTFKLVHQTALDFPKPAAVKTLRTFEVEPTAFAKAIRKVHPFSARQGTRYSFNACYLVRVGASLRLVATDGRRLGYADVPVVDGVEEPHRGVLIHARFLELIAKRLRGVTDPVRIDLSETQVSIAVGETSFASQLTEGQFPPYEKVIPKECGGKAVVKTAALRNAVRRGGMFCDNNGRGMRVLFEEKGLTFGSKREDRGESSVKVACEFAGEPLTIGFNPTFIASALQHAECEDVTLEVTQHNRPLMMRMGDDYACIVMPVNLS